MVVKAFIFWLKLSLHFQELQSLIPNSYVDELASDSSNIIAIISAAYDVSSFLS